MHAQHKDDQGRDFFDILGMLYRRKIVIAFPILLSVAIGWVIAAGQPPIYQANAIMVLDTRKTQVINIDSVLSRLPQEDAVLRSELDLISSSVLAEQVVDRLNLAEDPDLLMKDAFLPTRYVKVPLWVHPLRSLETSLRDWFPPGARLIDAILPEPLAPPNPPTRNQAVDHVLSGLKVSNDGRSYTILIKFSSHDPKHSALIANAVAEQYLNRQTEIKADATRQANLWLNRRLGELRNALENSEQAIEDFRQKEGLFESKGELLDATRLAKLNERLDQVRVQRLESEARLKSVREVIDRGGGNGKISEIAGSEVLLGLRQKEIELRRAIASRSDLGLKHPELIALTNDLAVVQQRSREEINRIVNTLSDEVEIARAQEASLEKTSAELKAEHGRSNNGSVVLRQLMREAEANRSIYEVVLNRYKETAEQVDLQRPDGSIISPASSEVGADRSRRIPIIAISALCGILLGIGLALLRERLDQTVRSVPGLERATGLAVIGLMPDMRHRWFARHRYRVRQSDGSAMRDALRVTQIAIRQHLTDVNRHAALRSQVVMVTSALAGEGKTTFCISLARMLAADGKRVMLIDADLRRPRVGLALKVAEGGDFVDLLEGTKSAEDVVCIDAKSGLHFVTSRSAIDNPQSLLTGVAFQRFLQVCISTYDIVIIDTPPVLSAVDSAVVAPLVNVCIFLARWGHTPLSTILAGLRLLYLCKVRIGGVVLSRVPKTHYRNYSEHPSFSGQVIYPPLYQPASQVQK
jgi:polysaccharide biosynthesis transport protein